MIGKIYERLTVIEDTNKRTKQRSKIWLCSCVCGNLIEVPTSSLVSGNTKSCGCLHKDSMKEMGERVRILNKYDLTGDYGIGYTSKGEPFYFDLEDYEKIKPYTWRYNQDGYVISQPNGKIIRMHMLIMDSDGTKDIDHINHVTYDNRKSQLRVCEHYQNIVHCKTYSNNTSGRKGVYWDKNREKWMVCLTVNKKTYHLGRFDDYNQAIKVREEAEQKYHKEFAYK